MTSELRDTGMTIRRAVMGDDHVDRSLESADELSLPLQELITEFGWGAVWGRPGLDRQTRSLLTVAMLTVLNRPHELKGHVRGALRNGCSREQVAEVIIQTAVYAGAPAALDGMRIAREVFAQSTD